LVKVYRFEVEIFLCDYLWCVLVNSRQSYILFFAQWTELVILKVERYEL
jgi:hypothetical protein